MNDQSGRKPGTFSNIPIDYDDPWNAVRGDNTAENNFISKTFGIKFLHYICLPDPLFQVNAGDARHSFGYDDGNQQFVDDERFHRENGLLYFKKGIVFGTFMGNAKDLRSVAAGLYGDSGATISMNRFYEDSEEKFRPSESDKLIPCELTSEFFSTNWQKFTHNPTGIDRMQFKACEVVMLIDSDGRVYSQGSDYNVVKGHIEWIDGGDRPGLDPKTGNGKVCSIRYVYKPYYYIKTVLLDIRIRPALQADGSIEAKAGPVLVQVQADWLYLDRRNNNDKDPAAQLDEGDGENTGPR